MSEQTPLKPDDFPIETDRKKLRTHEGKPIAAATSEKIADDIANRLNEHAYQEEHDRWSA
jgi:transposase